MGKISKYANIYKDGELVRHVNEHGVLDNYTIEETEELLNKLAEDKGEDGKVKDPTALNNVNSYLFSLYQKYGNQHEEELLELLKKHKESKTTEEEAKEKLNETLADLDGTSANENTDELPGRSTEEEHVPECESGENSDRHTPGPETIMDQYVEYEEIPA